MSAIIQTFREAERLGVRVRLDDGRIRLIGVPTSPEGDALVELVRQHKPELVERLTPWPWWQCSCGQEVRADQLRCPRPSCRRPRKGAIYEH